MNIKRILLLASMALAAIAFAAPAVAQANVTLMEEGLPLEEGAVVTGTSSNMLLTTEIGTTACTNATTHFEVLSNGDTHVVLKPLGEVEYETCFLTMFNPPPGTITNAKITENLTINTWGTGQAKAEFQWTLFFDQKHESPWTTCHFKGTVHVLGNEPGSDILNEGPSPYARTGFEEFCPTKSAAIEATFTLETSDGTPVSLNKFVTTE